LDQHLAQVFATACQSARKFGSDSNLMTLPIEDARFPLEVDHVDMTLDFSMKLAPLVYAVRSGGDQCANYRYALESIW
jgi:hypothetical protein